MVFTVSLLGAQHLVEVVENKPASSLVVTLDKALNGTPQPLCGRQVAQTSRKWQLLSECGHPVQNLAFLIFSAAKQGWLVDVNLTM